jgi:YbbR domain-containing protein
MARPSIPSLQDFRRNRLTRDQVKTFSYVLRAIALGRLPGEQVLSRWAVFTRLLAALIMSTVLWIYVTAQDNPVKDQQFVLPVVVRNLPPGLALRSPPPQTRVTVSGLQSNLNSAQSLTAFVDMRDVPITSGEATVPIRLEGMHSDLHYKWNPTSVSLVFERKESKSVKVLFIPQSSPPSSLSQLSAPQISPLLVTVAGPASSVDRVASAVVTAPLDQVAPTNTTGAPFTVTLTLVPQLQGAQGHPITDQRLTIIRGATITVTLHFEELYQIRTMTIAPIISPPAEGFVIGPQAPQPVPQTVLVVGSPQALGSQQSVSTDPIDIRRLTKTATVTAHLNLPPGVTTLTQGKAGSVEHSPAGPVWHVLVTVNKAKTSAVLPADVTVDHLAAGLDALPAQPWAKVYVTGGYVDLYRLSQVGLKARLDASHLGPGAYDLVPRVTMPPALPHYTVSPPTIHVVITRLPRR